MMARVRRGWAGPMGLSLILACTGCSYFRDRGRDARDIADIGITVSEKPGVGAYFGFCTLTTAGFAHVDGTLLGNVGRRYAGAIPMRYHNAGLLVWGEERMGYDGDYKPDDADTPRLYRTGPLGLATGPEPEVWKDVSCPKFVHVGFVGFSFTCRVQELLDFVLGWTTLDLMADDVADAPVEKPAK